MATFDSQLSETYAVTCVISLICGHVCDLANRNHHLREATIDDKLCTVSAPVVTYIPLQYKPVFVCAMLEHFTHSHRLVAPSEEPHRLLVSTHPLKIVTQTVQSMLQVADIRLVDVICYGTKSTPQLFGF